MFFLKLCAFNSIKDLSQKRTLYIWWNKKEDGLQPNFAFSGKLFHSSQFWVLQNWKSCQKLAYYSVRLPKLKNQNCLYDPRSITNCCVSIHDPGSFCVGVFIHRSSENNNWSILQYWFNQQNLSHSFFKVRFEFNWGCRRGWARFGTSKTFIVSKV